MNGMFSGCNSLSSLNLSIFNTSNVTDICNMFNGCFKLESLNLSTFDTSNVTNYESIFSGCNSLKEVTTNDKKLKTELGDKVTIRTLVV